jgi:predicted TIM-barrel fold metal-dependent hydrolase
MNQAIIDAHHHIWRRRDLPWLQGSMQPRIFGPYEAIRRDYPIGEYLADARLSGVEKSVYVQANWAKEHFADEAAYVQRAADETGCRTRSSDTRISWPRMSGRNSMR